jgi:hypothetical protein
MRNYVTVPFSKLRNRKNNVTVTFWPTLLRKKRCNRFISAKSVKEKNEEQLLFLKLKRTRICNCSSKKILQTKTATPCKVILEKELLAPQFFLI